MAKKSFVPKFAKSRFFCLSNGLPRGRNKGQNKNPLGGGESARDSESNGA